jgi:formate-dependent nitrite reductase membrane component NrfD
MTTQPIAIAPHRFAFGYYRQIWWNWLIGTAFFCGGLGSGLFLISLLTRHFLGMLIGYLIVVVGKNTAHLLYLGRPERFWRAAMRPDRSWIARGIWASGLLAVSGLLLLLPHVLGPGWALTGAAKTAASTVAIVSALFIMFYDGFVMNMSAAIPFWHTNLLPVLVLMYATLGGTTLAVTLRELQGSMDASTAFLARAEYFLLLANFLLLSLYLLRMSLWVPAARETVRLWLKGPYARAFFGLTLLVGLGATLLLLLVHSRTQATWLVVLIAACELTGDFTLLMLLLKSGLFAPQTAQAYGGARQVA